MNDSAAPNQWAAAGFCAADSLPEALRDKRYREALAFTDSLLAVQPRDAKVLAARGIALGGLHRDQESIAAFERALNLAPDFLGALQGAVEVGYRSRDPRTSDFLHRLLKIAPENEVAQAMAGVLAFEAGNCAVAVQHFDRAKNEATNNEQAYPLYGACLVKLQREPEAATFSDGQWTAAVAHLRRAISVTPQEESNYVDLAAIYLQRNLIDAAAGMVGAGLSNAPASARLYSLRGVIRAQSGRLEEAAADFDLANRLDAKQEYGTAGLGLLYTENRQSELAISVLRDRLKKSPDDFMLNYLLAQAIMIDAVEPGTPQLDQAQRALQRSIQSKPEFTRAHILLGKLYARVGEDQKAIVELELARKQSNQDRTVLAQLANVYKRLGRTDDAAAAISELRKAVTQTANSSR